MIGLKNERSVRGLDSLVMDIVLPTILTFMILFCLVQIGLSIKKPELFNKAPADEMSAISAFAI